MMKRFAVCFQACLCLSFPVYGSAELISTLADQRAVSVTIYNRDLALIRDVREIDFAAGLQTLAVREVSGRIRPETALLAAQKLQIFEQNFEYDLLSPASLLNKYVGRKVMLVKSHPTTGEERLEEATVLSTGNGVVLRVGDHIESGVPGRLIFPEVPENLRERPTLTLLLASLEPGKQQVELSYLSGGLSWQADYVAELKGNDESLSLNGWVTLNNESGATYHDARLKLVAGDVNQVQKQVQIRRGERRVAMAEAPSAAMEEESMFEYHLYTLARPTTIREKQSKQVALMHAEEVQVEKDFVLQGSDYYYRNRAGDLGSKLKVGVFVEMVNSHEAGLGQPLPAGVIRVYKKDTSGSLQFIGEDRIDHTPENERIRLKLGSAFDVTAEKKQTDFKKLSGFSSYNYAFESAFAITVKNGKEEAVRLRVVEPIPGDWQMIDESFPHKKEAANTAVWLLQVPAKASTTLSYRVQVKY